MTASQFIASYSNALNQFGLDSDQAKKIREQNANDPAFLEYADSEDAVYHCNHNSFITNNHSIKSDLIQQSPVHEPRNDAKISSIDNESIQGIIAPLIIAEMAANITNWSQD